MSLTHEQKLEQRAQGWRELYEKAARERNDADGRVAELTEENATLTELLRQAEAKLAKANGQVDAALELAHKAQEIAQRLLDQRNALRLALTKGGAE